MDSFTLSQTASSFQVSGLVPGCPYAFTVQPVCVNTDNSVVASTNSYTATRCTTPSELDTNPMTQTLTSITLTSVSVVSGVYYDLLVSYTAGCTGGTASSDEAVTSYPKEFTSLKSGCLYTFSLTPRCSLVESPTQSSDYVTGPVKTVKQCTSKDMFVPIHRHTQV